ncbi:hypothetical protein JCM5350_002556 [Sporobolomyces pararoseus]
MASSSPPPPPDPNRNGNNPFDKSHYSTTSSSSKGKRPSNSLQRAKTLSNPENETTWRRDPLLDITNSYLSSSRRLTRIDLPPRANDDLTLTPSPSSPSHLSRGGGGGGVPLRRTRSEVPGLVPLNSLDLSSFPVPRALPDLTPTRPPPSTLLHNDATTTPTRELRPRTRSSTSANQASPSPPSSSMPSLSPSTSSPVPSIAGIRRTRSSSNRSDASSSSPNTPATPPSVSTRGRRRTFGGLSTLPEDAAEDTSSDSRTPSISGSDDTGSVGERGGRGGSSENEHHRRLRRRRTVGGSSTIPTTTTTTTAADKKKVTGGKRSGLR